MNNTTSKQHLILISAGLVLLVLAAFEPLRHNDFIDYDDNDYITANPHIQSGLTWNSIRWAFTGSYAANWHPLTWLSHMIDIELFGLNPLGHHLHNLLLHTLGTILLFLILHDMTGSLWMSAFVAMVFGIHPLRVESVAWAAERKDVLSALLFMLTITAYVYYIKQKSVIRYVLVLFCFVLGLMAKPMLVTVPLLLLILDFWPLKRIQSNIVRLILEKVPLFILAFLSCLITYQAQKQTGSISNHLSLSVRLSNALMSYTSYLQKTVWPFDLGILYPYSTHYPLWKPAAAALFLAGCLCVVIYRRNKQPYLFTGWLWYMTLLTPVIGIIQVGRQSMADRYTYLPSIGLYILCAWSLVQLSSRRYWLRILLGILSIASIPAMILATRHQLTYWKDSVSLYEHTLSITTSNYAIENNLAMALLGQNQIQEAAGHLTRVLAVHPDDPYANINMALILIHRSQSQQAVDCLHKALDSPSADAAACFRIGLLLQNENKYDDAACAYEKTLRLDHNHTQALNNMGVLKNQKGFSQEAVVDFRRAINIDPAYIEAHRNLAIVMQEQGKLEEAISQYQTVLAAQPDDDTVSLALAFLFSKTGNLHDSAGYYRKTLQLKPNCISALNDLAWILAVCPDHAIQNPHESVQLARQACQLTDFKDPSFLDTLAVAYAANNQFKDAVETAQKAIDSANSLGQADLASRIEKRLKLYRDYKPYCDPAPKQ